MDYDNAEEVPGTSKLVEEGVIILWPSPTKSPNDPLNWSLPRKYWHAFLVCFITGFTAATSNDAATAQYGENTDLGISYATMNTGAGVLFIGIGYATLLFSPAPWLWGRRINYLFCILLGLVGALWMARTQTAQDSIWNQLFVGASESCAEAGVQLSLSDLFFEHQRGTFLGVYVLATSIGTYLGPLVGGFIADSSEDWRWVGWWAVIISGGTLLVFYFTLEETMFDRSLSTDLVSQQAVMQNNSDGLSEKDPEAAVSEKKIIDEPSPENRTWNGSTNDLPKTYWQRIALVTPAPNLKGWGIKQYFKRLFLVLRVFSFPAVIFSGLQWGAQDAWLTFYLTVEDDNWYGPPWNYSDAGVGMMNIPCLIGAVIGCFYGGYLSDKFVLWMAKRNGGVREAEHRLWFLLPCAIISPIGMLLFGIGTGQSWNWPVPYVGLGFIGFGWGCAGDLSMAYLVDAYPSMVLEGMVGVAVINNSIACIFTFTASIWLDNQGPQNTFIAIACLDFFFTILTVPMMIWGKTARRWTKGRYLDFLNIRDSMDG
jgi:MFS family permease